ncbi:ISL3 family transposase [Amycolatopsis sp. QT-25]|uniref:ISL3 family transposase n=1 Tax=Amycolatopsis sp. QT-25 TaxID=3034022 RepID=UPI0023EA80B5|nr:ISL3 family transposase [Amycolatopsis sp. QT-25]WET81636.1 ISL3 family transposase [Amycolatopsis sp. QT-25]
MVKLAARVRRKSGVCGRCGVASTVIHGCYLRRLSDAPTAGVRVVIELTVRRFRCVNDECAAVTFAEQVAGLTRPHSRYTPLLRDMLSHIGLAMAGRAGARLATALGITVGRDTLLRVVRALPEKPIGRLPVLGVDDFAFRRGRRYGTILIDLQTHAPVDVLDGREGSALATWLRTHPGVEVICRDRAGGYAEGARTGATDAIQVADRFHLWQNLGQAVERTVNTYRASLAAPAPSPAAPVSAAPSIVQSLPEKKIVTRFRHQYTAASELFARGWSKAAIGRELGLHPATVRKLVTAGSVDDLIAKTEQRAHLVDDYVEYLHRRWHEGERNATQLYREITKLGYPGGELAVQRYLRRFRHGRGFMAQRGPKPPSVREVTSWIMTHPDHLDTDDTTALTAITTRSPELDQLATYVREFATMMTKLRGYQLKPWITAVEQDRLPALASFARNLRHDYNAIHNGLSLPYNSGPVEGAVNRIKMLKRQMFGRAELDLLRKRILLAPR